MRRLTDITVEVEDRLGPARGRTRRRAPQPAAKKGRGSLWRLRLRWPAPLRSRAVRWAVVGAAVTIGAAALSLWFPAHRLAQRAVLLTARAGFKVDDIFVEGRVRTPRDQLLEALAVRRGDAMFGIDLAAARRRLEDIPGVRSATVERRLPDRVHLLIVERVPIALWQNKGRYFLVDGDGQVVGDQVEDYADLPLTVGDGAPAHAAELVALLQSEDGLRARVKAAQWVGDRRWNITLDQAADSIEVRLPEDDPLAAWHELARLEREQSLLERQVGLIDMRLPDRLVLRPPSSAHDQAAGSPVKRKPPAGKDA